MKKLFLGFMLVSNILIVHASNSTTTNLSVDFVVVDPCVNAAVAYADALNDGDSGHWSSNYGKAYDQCKAS